MRKAITFMQLPFRTKFTCLEAFTLLGVSRACVLAFPFKSIASHLGTLGEETDLLGTSVDLTKVEQISWVIEKIARFTPWNSNCLAKAITSKVMLRRRKVECTLYLGVKKVNAKLEAHAWVRVGKKIVTGDTDLEQFTIVAFFGKNK